MPPANTFAGATIDRAGARRADVAWVAEQLADPNARALAVSTQGPYVECEADLCRPARFPLADLGEMTEPVLLGIESGTPLFAVDVEGRADGLPALDRTRTA